MWGKKFVIRNFWNCRINSNCQPALSLDRLLLFGRADRDRPATRHNNQHACPPRVGLVNWYCLSSAPPAGWLAGWWCWLLTVLGIRIISANLFLFFFFFSYFFLLWLSGFAVRTYPAITAALELHSRIYVRGGRKIIRASNHHHQHRRRADRQDELHSIPRAASSSPVICRRPALSDSAIMCAHYRHQNVGKPN